MPTDWMPCGRCGEDCIESDADGGFLDGQTATCPKCGAVNVASADGDEAWLGHWTCKHGKDDATPCSECDAEDEGAESTTKDERSDR
jgi:hypothetical protein